MDISWSDILSGNGLPSSPPRKSVDGTSEEDVEEEREDPEPPAKYLQYFRELERYDKEASICELRATEEWEERVLKYFKTGREQITYGGVPDEGQTTEKPPKTTDRDAWKQYCERERPSNNVFKGFDIRATIVLGLMTQSIIDSGVHEADGKNFFFKSTAIKNADDQSFHVDQTMKFSKEFEWILFSLFFLDDLQALEADMSWELQKLRRECERRRSQLTLNDQQVPFLNVIITIIRRYFKQL